ncbi:MAG: GTPase Era [Thiotrichales bacterium]
MNLNEIITHCGSVVIAGRPNVGKSTLLNQILGTHLAATAPKPQTTRNQILGIHTEGDYQMLFLDTPGIHDDRERPLNRRLNKAALASLPDADVVLFVIEAGQWTDEDERVLGHLASVAAPVLLVINKIDRLSDRAALLPFIDSVQQRRAFAEVVPLSAFETRNVNYLLRLLRRYLPAGPFQYGEDEITDRNLRFLSAEMIREQLTRFLEQEVPYTLGVEIEQFKEGAECTEIGAVIYVEREGQKGIVIGKGGAMLKKVGSEARRRIEGILGGPVFLQLWVKVKPGWTESPGWLDKLGMDVEVRR